MNEMVFMGLNGIFFVTLEVTIDNVNTSPPPHPPVPLSFFLVLLLLNFIYFKNCYLRQLFLDVINDTQRYLISKHFLGSACSFN